MLDHVVVIDGNVLHECNGASPGLDGAGVLASVSVGARILNNVIYGNAGGDAIGVDPTPRCPVRAPT